MQLHSRQYFGRCMAMLKQRLRKYSLSLPSYPLCILLGIASAVATLYRSWRCAYSLQSAASWRVLLSFGLLFSCLSIIFFPPASSTVGHSFGSITRPTDYFYLLPLAGLFLRYRWKRSFVILSIMIVCFRYQFIGLVIAYLFIIKKDLTTK